QLRLDGVPLSASAWQSRKARDLLRILVARRGRATARDELADLLWPEDDPEKRGPRLSVALSTLRAVLDPGRQAPPDQFVLAGRSGIALDVTHVELDLESFLGEAAHGLRLRDQGYLDEARTVLAAAERRYGGDLLEDEPYDDWAVPARE